MPEPLEPTDIWTADGRRVGWRGPGERAGRAFPAGRAGSPALPEVLGALTLAPVAAAGLAAGIAFTAATVLTGVTAAAARSLFGRRLPAGPGVGLWGVPRMHLTVVYVELDGRPSRRG